MLGFEHEFLPIITRPRLLPFNVGLLRASCLPLSYIGKIIDVLDLLLAEGRTHEHWQPHNSQLGVSKH